MATKKAEKTERIDKYADFVYVMDQTELEEALWLIEQGDFKDLDDFVESSRRAQINIWKRADAERERKAELRRKNREKLKKQKKAA